MKPFGENEIIILVPVLSLQLPGIYHEHSWYSRLSVESSEFL